MKRDTRAKIDDDAVEVGNLKILGVDYIASRIISKNKIHESKFLVSVEDDGTVMYALSETAGEFKLLDKGKVIGYYRKTTATETIEEDRRLKPSLRRDLTHFLEECGFIRRLKE
jgi:hypothetical protein